MEAQQERTFLMIKPDGVHRSLVGKIISRFEDKGFKLVGMKFLVPSQEILEEHYAEHKARPFFKGLTAFMASGPVVAMVWEGVKVVETGRKMLGATKPFDSLPGTIRGDFGIDVGRNIMHGSDGVESAKKEIGIWFKNEELFKWTPVAQPWIYE